MLASKLYADNKGTSYAYTPAGRLLTRTWQRGVTTTYGYDFAGRLTSIDYSDGTPDISYTLNRLDQVKRITDGSGEHSLTYDPDGRLLTEQYHDGMLLGIKAIHSYDSLLRRTTYQAQSFFGGSFQFSYSYDATSRLKTVTSGSDSATYSYLPDSSLVGALTQTHGGNPALTTTKTHDFLNRLTSISAATGAGVVASHAYTYSALNQRTEAALHDGTSWHYGYDLKGQITSARPKWSGSTPVAGQQFGYGNDGIGNRTNTTVNGRAAQATRPMRSINWWHAPCPAPWTCSARPRRTRR